MTYASGMPFSPAERAKDAAERKRCTRIEIAHWQARQRVYGRIVIHPTHTPAECLAARKREARMLGELEAED
jgi:hypothetical protein